MDSEEILDKVIKIAKEAGLILLKYYHGDFKVEWKGGNHFDLVTSADYAVDKDIREKLKKEFPSYKILSEETESTLKDYSGKVWIVDPLDGTSTFSKREKGFCVIIGLCEDGIPKLGVVYDPLDDVVYFAKKEEGAYMQKGKTKTKIKVSKVNSLSKAKAVIKKSDYNNKPYDKISELIKIKKHVSGLSAGIRLMKIASGKMDFYFEGSYRASKWDTCGTQVILEEAGGKISGINKPLNYLQKETRWPEPFLASNKVIHEKVLDQVFRALKSPT